MKHAASEGLVGIVLGTMVALTVIAVVLTAVAVAVVVGGLVVVGARVFGPYRSFHEVWHGTPTVRARRAAREALGRDGESQARG
jgi:uncharacterized membrane protein